MDDVDIFCQCPRQGPQLRTVEENTAEKSLEYMNFGSNFNTDIFEDLLNLVKAAQASDFLRLMSDSVSKRLPKSLQFFQFCSVLYWLLM